MSGVRFEPLAQPAGRWRALLAWSLALSAGLGAASLLFLLKGVNPWTAISAIYTGSFGSAYGCRESITKGIPLLLTGAGLALAFRARVWNIGAEGQMLAGAIAASGLALFGRAHLPTDAVIPLMFGLGAIAGGLAGLVPAALRVSFGISEAISSLMLNYVMSFAVLHLINGPWKGAKVWGMATSDDFARDTWLSVYSTATGAPTRIHLATLAIGLAVAIGLTVALARTRFGFAVRVVGENPEAARYAGISEWRTILAVMLISGALAGMAGVGEVAGIHHRLTAPASVTSGYGFTAIIVAYLARTEPAAVILSALFLGGLLVGGDAIQTSLGLPLATVHIFNGMILLALIVGDFFRDHRLRWSR